MNKKELIEYIMVNNVQAPVLQIVMGMLVALVLTLLIYEVYKKTYSGIMYSKDFNVTIVMIGLITTFIIMVIGSNLALSLGMVGALSILRFRTAVKEAKDAGFIFWAIGVGLSCGTGIYTIGIVGSLFISATLLLFSHLGNKGEMAYLLVVRGERLNEELMEKRLQELAKRYIVKMTNHDGVSVELTYGIQLKGTAGQLSGSLREEFPDVQLHLISYNGEIAGE